MQSFLYEIVARLFAAYLAYDSCREIRNGLDNKESRQFSPSFLQWSRLIVRKSVEPVWYWVEIWTQAFIVAACLFIVIFGWPRSSK